MFAKAGPIFLSLRSPHHDVGLRNPVHVFFDSLSLASNFMAMISRRIALKSLLHVAHPFSYSYYQQPASALPGTGPLAPISLYEYSQRSNLDTMDSPPDILEWWVAPVA